jgi:DNA recombination protein RmuC
MIEGILVLAALVAGLAIGWAVWGRKLGQVDEQLRAESIRGSVAEDRAARIPSLEAQVQSQSQEVADLRAKQAELTAQLDAARRNSEEQVALLVNAKEALGEQFQNLANKIFEERGTKFVAQNQEAMEGILKPLRERLGEFKTKVEEVYDKESKERFSLQNEIKRLVELNSRISVDATNLTNALKGQSKTQGSWGEMVLERVLEASGLQKGREYDVQVNVSVDGRRLQPDVIIRLPEGKNIIVDSKVSLTAYEEYCSTEEDGIRAAALKRHVGSIRGHITDLSGKNYQALYGVKSPDYVLMFMHIEPAFKLAMESDQNLYTDAIQKNIMIVGPWNLLISLKTISSIWRYEYQNRNAQELARQCAALYDKFVGFVADVEDIGKKIDSAHGSYQAALGKLSTGKGNLVRSVERIRQLGVTPSKLLPSPLVEAASEQGETDVTDEHKQ